MLTMAAVFAGASSLSALKWVLKKREKSQSKQSLRAADAGGVGDHFGVNSRDLTPFQNTQNPPSKTPPPPPPPPDPPLPSPTPSPAWQPGVRQAAGAVDI